MKKILIILAFTILLLTSCSSGEPVIIETPNFSKVEIIESVFKKEEDDESIIFSENYDKTRNATYNNINRDIHFLIRDLHIIAFSFSNSFEYVTISLTIFDSNSLPIYSNTFEVRNIKASANSQSQYSIDLNSKLSKDKISIITNINQFKITKLHYKYS